MLCCAQFWKSALDMAFTYYVYCLLVSMPLYMMDYLIKLIDLFFGKAYVSGVKVKNRNLLFLL